MKTVRATIDRNGEVHLHGKIDISGPCEAVVTIFEGGDRRAVDETALLVKPPLPGGTARRTMRRHLRPAVSSDTDSSFRRPRWMYRIFRARA